MFFFVQCVIQASGCLIDQILFKRLTQRLGHSVVALATPFRGGAGGNIGKNSSRFSRVTPQRPNSLTPGVSMTAPPKSSGYRRAEVVV